MTVEINVELIFLIYSVFLAILCLFNPFHFRMWFFRAVCYVYIMLVMFMILTKFYL